MTTVIFCPACGVERYATRAYGPLGNRVRERGEVFRWVNICATCGSRYTTIAPVDERNAAKRVERLGQLRLFGGPP